MTVKVDDPEPVRGRGQAHRHAVRELRRMKPRRRTEKAFTKQFMEQIGNIGKILVSVVFAVFFTMLLVTANTHGAVGARTHQRDRRTEDAGLQRRRGAAPRDRRGACSSPSLGGLIGFGLAYLAVGGLAADMKKYFPVFEIDSSTIIISLVLMVALGVITGLWPAVSAMRLKITDALRQG